MNPKKNAQAEKNLDLIHRHLQKVLEHPESINNIPDGAYVIHLPMYDKWLLDENLVLAKQCALEGKPVLLLPVSRNSDGGTSTTAKTDGRICCSKADGTR